THRLDTIGEMSCNPAIGGVGERHLWGEIGAREGVMARALARGGHGARRPARGSPPPPPPGPGFPPPATLFQCNPQSHDQRSTGYEGAGQGSRSDRRVRRLGLDPPPARATPGEADGLY
ncbi:hypothetical protein DS843_16750, partial [Roseomonas genomospecies 6]